MGPASVEAKKIKNNNKIIGERKIRNLGEGGRTEDEEAKREP